MEQPVITIVSATVRPEREQQLIAAYRSVTSVLPSELRQSFLVRRDSPGGSGGSGRDAHEWRIVSVWRSREQLDQYRRSVGTQPAIEMLRAAGGDPTMSTFSVIHQVGHDVLGAPGHGDAR